MKKHLFSLIIISSILFTTNLFLPQQTRAQNVGISSTGAVPNSSAMLDVSSTNTGLLIPRVSLTITTSNAPVGAGIATSLLVYNTATVNDVTSGYYYWDGSKWVRLQDGASADDWHINGNNNTTSGTNFIGTTNLQDLDIRTNGIIRTRITTKGQIETMNTGNSVFIGEEAGENDDLSSNQNVFVGYNSGKANTSGSHNTAIGNNSLMSLTTEVRNTAIGSYSLYNNNGEDNVAIGYYTMPNNTSGIRNVACGTHSLVNNTTGGRNTAIGYGALWGNTVGIYNTGNGDHTLYDNISGNYNTANGSAALTNNTTGDYNVGVGRFAGQNITTGSYNTVIGSNADVGAGIYTNATVIGNGAIATSSNQIRLGNNSVISLYCQGVYAATTAIAPNVYVSATGQIMRSTAAGGGSDDDWLPLGAANTDLIYHEGEVNTKEINGVVVVGTNGYTDIQTAINALPATGGKVLITEGTWNVPNDIIFPNDNITVEGVGKSTILNCTVNDQIFYISGRNNIEIKNMTIQYSSYVVSSARDAIYIYRSTNCVVSNCTILNAYCGIHLNASSTQYTEHNNIHDNIVKNGRYGIGTSAGISSSSYYYVRRNHIHHNIIQNMVSYGIVFNGNSDANHITNNEIKNTDSQGIILCYSDSCVISNNRVTHIQTRLGTTTGVGINLQGCSNSIISDNYIADISGTVSNGSGIRVIYQSSIYCYNTTITGNQIHLDGSLTGIRVTIPRRAIISNNIIYNTQGSATYAYPAIMVDGTSPQNVLISNNLIYGSTTATSSGENYSGILCTDGPLYCNISNNTVYGYRRGLTVNAGGNNVIQGNNSSGSNDGLFFTNSASTIIMGNNANGTGLSVAGSTPVPAANQNIP
jgi:parallel beta-helix repeat protein